MDEKPTHGHSRGRTGLQILEGALMAWPKSKYGARRAIQSDCSEWEIHKAVVSRLLYRRDLLAWHTPNGGYRGTIAAMQFKRAGVLPGVSDLIVLRDAKPPLAWEL
jgi:hypothetical protein